MTREGSLEGVLAAVLKPLIVEAVAEALAARGAAPVAGGLVTMAAFAKSRGVSVSTVRAAIRDGRLQAVRIGRSVRIAADATLGEPVRARDAAKPAARAARILGLVGAAK